MYNEYYFIDITVENLLKYEMCSTSRILYKDDINQEYVLKILIIQTEEKHDRETYISDI